MGFDVEMGEGGEQGGQTMRNQGVRDRTCSSSLHINQLVSGDGGGRRGGAIEMQKRSSSSNSANWSGTYTYAQTTHCNMCFSKLSAVENVHNRQIMLSITTPTPQTTPDRLLRPTYAQTPSPRSPRKLNRYTTPPYPSGVARPRRNQILWNTDGQTRGGGCQKAYSTEVSKSCMRPLAGPLKSGEFGGLALVCQDRYIGSLGCVVHAQDCLYLPDKKTGELHGIAPRVYLTSTRVIVQASSLAVKFENAYDVNQGSFKGQHTFPKVGKITAHPEFDVKSKLELRLKRMSTW
uniref:Uncharacterized protein n=1 Tax=Coccidioides posadasii RMSCC 3488 TaxID=454284 RepID=A0A0J6F180_COCPO|nr:hypothetical protein CPAG_02934 [Coccidioides posadasii RMSCC 3488]